MTLIHHDGGCHCGAIRVSVGLAQAAQHYAPRACDCDFCRKHGAAYVSDPDGSLRIELADAHSLGRYRQGSGRAECLVCTRCGVLIGVAYSEDSRIYATLNSRIVDGGARFAEPVAVSPKTLSAAEKIERWKRLWFADVALVDADADGKAIAPGGAKAARKGDIRIERALGADAEEILALQRRAYASEARLYGDWTIPPLTQNLASLREDIATMIVLKACDNEAIVGSVRARVVGAGAQIGRLIVDPPRERQGIGSQLLRAIEAALPDAERFELFTGSRSAGNLRLYQRHGYAMRETRQLSERVSIVFLEKPASRS